MDLLKSFKVQKCSNLDCSLNSKLILIPLIHYLKCADYHTEKDQRRYPFNNNKGIAYEPYYFCNSNQNNNQFCNNLIEYLFHPNIYKSISCSQIKCNSLYCPYYHAGQNDFLERKETPQEEFKKSPIQIVDSISELPSSLQVSRNQSVVSIIKQLDMKGKLKKTSLSRNNQQQKQKKNKNSQLYTSSVVKIDTKTIKAIQDLEASSCGEQSFTLAETQKQQIYLMNQTIPFFEDSRHEFKMLKQIRMDMVSKYICAFLNASGGALYIGITDSGRIRGIKLKRQDIDLFQLELDHILRKFDPCVLSEQIILYFNPIYDESKKIYSDMFIIEIKVKSMNKYELYFTHKKEAYIKKAASINLLTPREIKAYVQQRTFQKIEDKNKGLLNLD